MNVSSKNKTAVSHVVQIHSHARFPWSKKWPTYHVAVCRTNNKAFQRKSLKNFRPSSATEKVSIVCGTTKHMKSEMLSNRHTDRHTHRHTDQVL